MDEDEFIRIDLGQMTWDEAMSYQRERLELFRQRFPDYDPDDFRPDIPDMTELLPRDIDPLDAEFIG